MAGRSTSLLPRSIRARKRLKPREAIWVYAPLCWLLCGLLLLGLGIYTSTLNGAATDTMAILSTCLGTLFIVISGIVAFMILDREPFPKRKERMLRDRPRKTREHKARQGFKELKNDCSQYGVEVTRSGSDMEFAVIRYNPPTGGWISRHLAPWPCEKERWDTSSERWTVEGYVLRVTNPQTNLLVEAYCEASEAARAMEEEAYDRRAKQVALEGMALAFTPPDSKSTNEEQLEKIRERVQVRRLLDSGE